MAKREKGIPPDALDKVRADFSCVIEMGFVAEHVVRAKLMLAEAYLFAKKPEEAESMADKFLAEDYEGSKNLHGFPVQVLTLHLVVAQAALMQNNYEKALQANGRVEELYNQLSKKEQGRPNVRRALTQARGQRSTILRMSELDLGD